MMYKYCHFESTHNYQQMSLKIFYIQYAGVSGLFNSNIFLLYFMNYYFELGCADKYLQRFKISDAAEQVELPPDLFVNTS